MGTYASTSDIAARLPYRTIDSNSKPTSTQVGQWITEAEAMLTAALDTCQITTPVTNSNGIELLKSWACDYAEGRTRMAYANSGGDGGNDDGKDLIENFKELIDKILDNPTMYSAMFNAGDAEASSRRVRGYVLDNDDSVSISNGDFEPTFTKSGENF